MNAQEEERYQLAMELHDNVQQILTAASLNVSFLETTPDDASSRKVVRDLKTSLTEATNELRRLSEQLAPSIDPVFQLGDKISTLVNSMNVNGRLKTKVNVDPAVVLDEKAQLGFYRIIQEQLTNIIKHAKTSEVEISIQPRGENIILNIVDNGIGFDVNLKKNGIGFENIRRRTESMNGSLEIVSSPGQGSRVTVQVPKLLLINGLVKTCVTNHFSFELSASDTFPSHFSKKVFLTTFLFLHRNASPRRYSLGNSA